MIERIIKIRKAEELSQEKFAERIGLSRNFINQVESGKKNISDRTINDICREFGINEVWLRTGEGGDENMRRKLPDEDRFSLNLGKLSESESEFVRRGVNLLAETDPEKLKVLEEFMKKWLGIDEAGEA